MKLRFVVGQAEPHDLTFRFNKFWGNLSIAVDGDVVRRDFRLFSVRLVKRYELSVGNAERHQVVIEKHRELVLAGLRPQPVRAFVDGQLVAEGIA